MLQAAMTERSHGHLRTGTLEQVLGEALRVLEEDVGGEPDAHGCTAPEEEDERVVPVVGRTSAGIRAGQ